MHTVELFAEAVKEHWLALPCEPVRAVCAITGHETDCVPRKNVISDGFTNQTLLEAADSSYMSVDSFRAFKYRPERSSWFINKKDDEKVIFKALKRQDIRDIVLKQEAITGVWACYASTTGKKHGALYARLNDKNSGFFAMDANVIDCSDFDKTVDWYNRLDRYLRLGIGRKSLESLTLIPAMIKKIGFAQWKEFKEWASDKYRSSLYKFLIYLLPSQAELKEEQKKFKIVAPKEKKEVLPVKKQEKTGQISLF